MGKSHDDAHAETIDGLHKAEVILRQGPWRDLAMVEYATVVWIDPFDDLRLLEPIGYVPPAEYEAAYYRGQETQAMVA
ncbi:MAG: hypothetical protein IPK07_25850 [Deltaproteobacteria bacterium]|nr:hypothetical protein [Deltaproteobacteria bacterium]